MALAGIYIKKLNLVLGGLSTDPPSAEDGQEWWGWCSDSPDIRRIICDSSAPVRIQVRASSMMRVCNKIDELMLDANSPETVGSVVSQFVPPF